MKFSLKQKAANLYFVADSPDVIFSDRSRKGKKFYKDSEKVPLGDHDELSMI